MMNSEKSELLSDGNAIQKIGTLRMVSSGEIKDSPVSVGFECLDREMFDPEPCYEKLGAIGVKWARCQTGWNRCETKKGIYDFAWLDRIVDRLMENGVRVWFNLGYGNALYMGSSEKNETCVGCVPMYYGEETWTAWLNYVAALAKHFASRVKRWEIWNEPEGAGFWHPRTPDPLEYAKFIRRTAPVIRAHVPDAEIGSCSFTTFTVFYQPAFIRSGIGEILDFHCVHHYRIQPEKDYAGEIALLRRLFDENGGTRVRLFQGECGYASWFPEHHWLGTYVMESELNQAKWLLRRYATDLGLGMEMSSFFQMADMMGRPYKMADVVRTNPARHGLLNGLSYTPKRSYYAMAHICALFDSDTENAPLYFNVNTWPGRPKNIPVSRLAEAAIQKASFIRNGFPMYLYYVPEDVQCAMSAFRNMELNLFPDERPGLRIEDPVLADLLTGDVYRPETFESFEHGGVWRVSGLPMTDYPLLLTDRCALGDRLTMA